MTNHDVLLLGVIAAGALEQLVLDGHQRLPLVHAALLQYRFGNRVFLGKKEMKTKPGKLTNQTKNKNGIIASIFTLFFVSLSLICFVFVLLLLLNAN